MTNDAIKQIFNMLQVKVAEQMASGMSLEIAIDDVFLSFESTCPETAQLLCDIYHLRNLCSWT